LAHALRHDEVETVRTASAEALGSLGLKNDESMLALIDGLTDKSRCVRLSSIMALGECGSAARRSIPLIEKQLGREKGFDLLTISEALLKIDASNSNALASIGHCIRHSNPKLRIAAALSLGQSSCDTSKTLPLLTDRLYDPVPHVRQAAAHSLSRMGASAVAAVPPLIDCLNDPDEKVQLYVTQALGMVGKSAEKAVPSLVKLLSTKRLRLFVVQALGEIQSDAPRSVPAIISVLRDADADLRKTAVVALEKFGSQASSAEVPLGLLLEDPVADVRFFAAQALGSLGGSNEKVTHQLRLALKDENPFVREAAQATLLERSKVNRR
jgi:HEAT repeat protein